VCSSDLSASLTQRLSELTEKVISAAKASEAKNKKITASKNTGIFDISLIIFRPSFAIIYGFVPENPEYNF
jgi:hypothetical protein